MKQYDNRIEKIVVEYLAPAMEFLLVPFHRSVTGIHNSVGRVLTYIIPEDTEVEYIAWQNKYRIAAEWWNRSDPDEYQIGHFAGRVSMLLGVIPLGLGWLLINIFGWLVPADPGKFVAVLIPVISFALPIFMLVALTRLMTLSVEYHVKPDTEYE